MKKNNIDRFLARKEVKEILGNMSITQQQRDRLDALFDKYGSPKKLENMLRTRYNQ